jgi:MYXO-CTERM domain-containing protein
VNGVCGEPTTSGGAPGSAGSISIDFGSGGRSTGNGDGGTPGAGSGNTNSGGPRREAAEAGCNCRTVPSGASRLGIGVAALAVLSVIARRRRKSYANRSQRS